MDVQTFIESWTKSLANGSAAVFIGAGISRRVGYPDWRSLLKDIADELGLDVELEHDLASVAQYSLNRSAGKRTRLTQLIVNHFPPKSDAPFPLRVLARLPLRHIWTTNYDKLIEVAWQLERKLLDVKSSNNDLGIESPWANATLYKMHGSVEHPAEVVIAKDDYEMYRRHRPGFLQALSGHLVSKQMLFLGFSFTDPNIHHLFANIREVFQQDGPGHYAIVRRPARASGAGSRKRFEFDKIRHALWVEDLQRYGIQCVEVDEYNDADQILAAVEFSLSARSVFVSGSLPENAEPSQRKYVEAVAREIGRAIAESEKRLVSGFGLVVGSAVVSGALGVVLSGVTPNLDRSLLLRPFPQESPTGFSKEEFYKRYREGLVQQSGACIFICGLKEETKKGKPIIGIASGVMEEFQIAKELMRTPIPIGATGGAAAEIWLQVSNKLDELCPYVSRLDFDALNTRGLEPKKIAQIVKKIIRAVDKGELPLKRTK